MKNFYSTKSVSHLEDLLDRVIKMKENPLAFEKTGRGKLLVLLFFNPSLRTRLSTQKAAFNLGMQAISMDMKAGWAWEIEDGSIMKFDTAEHIKEAAGVLSSYADIVGIRSFPSLTDRDNDQKDQVLNTFMNYCSIPVINLESAVFHPLQSLADLVTINEYKEVGRPKIVLSWAPHPKSLPHSVAHSFLQWMHYAGNSVTVTHPKGLELSSDIMEGHTVEYNQEAALKDADFVYVKNWSSFTDYGKVADGFDSWMITLDKMTTTNNGKLLHCLPVRRNVVISDDALDSNYSLVQQLAANRLYSAQAVLHTILTQNNGGV